MMQSEQIFLSACSAVLTGPCNSHGDDLLQRACVRRCPWRRRTRRLSRCACSVTGTGARRTCSAAPPVPVRPAPTAPAPATSTAPSTSATRCCASCGTAPPARWRRLWRRSGTARRGRRSPSYGRRTTRCEGTWPTCSASWQCAKTRWTRRAPRTCGCDGDWSFAVGRTRWRTATQLTTMTTTHYSSRWSCRRWSCQSSTSVLWRRAALCERRPEVGYHVHDSGRQSRVAHSRQRTTKSGITFTRGRFLGKCLVTQMRWITNILWHSVSRLEIW